MTTADDRLWRLHVRKARGELLTSDEQAALDAWYAEQDREETLLPDAAKRPGSLGALKGQVDAVLERIAAASQAIQTVSAENEALRLENSALRANAGLPTFRKVGNPF